ncbi:MAG: hypothetical protein AAF720_01400 [Pseudomonadota bacterium]
MSNPADIDVSHIKFSSTAFPTAEDLKLWHSLSEAEKYAVTMRDVKEGLEGPAAERSSLEEMMADVMADYVDAH